jgi:hypothetical protein
MTPVVENLDPFHGTFSYISSHFHHSGQYTKYRIGVLSYKIILRSENSVGKYYIAHLIK